MKTVYILGAGFSKSAGAPLQSEIIREIFSLTPSHLQDKNYCALFFDYRNDLKTLLSEIFFISEDKFIDFSLEDMYSIIDRCLIDNISLRRLGKIDLIEIRNKINALIIMLMHYKLEYTVSKKYIQKFSNYLFEKRKNSFENDKDSNPFTIISMNWDIVLDNGLQSIIGLYNYKSSNVGIPTTNGFIDYGFEINAYNQYEFGRDFISSTNWRGENYFNIKLLKLHGSMNWLQCQRCQKIFITFFNKIALEQFLSKPTCNYCSDERSKLLSVLIMPTFLKDLNIVQLKLSWQIAAIELQEASKILFIGYSFPMTDFEFRQLLARSVRTDAEIDVVLHSNDEPERFGGIHKANKFLPEQRYKSFFGKRNINFFYEGVENYIDANYNS